MKFRCRIRSVLPIAAVALALLALPASAAELPSPLPDSDGKPVQVFLLCGQSNMVGHGKTEWGLDVEASKKAGKNVERKGGIGCLRDMVNKDPKTFGHGGTNPLVDADGKWLIRKDVHVYARVNEQTKKGGHTTGFGKGSWNGPEYGFGQVVGNALDQDVLIIKVARGGTSLARDWRPPGAVKKRGGEVGPMWKQMKAEVKLVLDNLDKEFPELVGRDYEFVGFGWHQGFNDAVTKEFAPEYEKNLVDLIHDVRTEFGKPELPFVIGTTSMWPPENKDNAVELAQRAVADPTQHPEFNRTVATVDTGPIYRDKSISPSGFGYHWNHNGVTHYQIGEAMGKAMVELMKNE